MTLVPSIQAAGIASQAFGAAVNGATFDADKLASVLLLLQPAQVANIAATSGLKIEQLETMLSTKALTEEQRQEILTLYADIKAKMEDSAANGGLSLSTLSLKNIWAGLNATILASPIFWVAAVLGGVAIAYKAVTAWADRYKNKLTELREEYDNLSGEVDSLQSELSTNQSRLEELESLEAPTLVDQDEIKRLKQANTELETQIALLKAEQELKQDEVNKTFNQYVDQQKGKTYTHYEQGVTDSYAATAGTSQGPRNITGGTSQYSYEEEIAAKIAEAKNAQAEITKNIAAMAETDDAAEQKRLEAENQKLKDQKESAMRFLREEQQALTEQADGVVYNDNTAEALDFVHDLQIKVLALEGDAEQTNVALNQLFNDPRYAGDGGATETLRDAVGEYSEAFADYQKIVAEAKRYNVDLSQTVYGNIDTDARQRLEWTKENVEKYREILASWGENADDYLGTYSTVTGMWDTFDGVDIAFTPILNTENGPVYLDHDTVYNYIDALLKEVSKKGSWTTEDLLALDAKGLEGFLADGSVLKGLLAGVGEEAERAAEAMHFTGADGAVKDAAVRVRELRAQIQTLYATNPQVKSLVDTLISLGLFSWDNLDELANQMGYVAEQADNVTAAVSAWSELSKATDDLVSATETLRDAQKELADGYLSSNTLKSMQAQYDAMAEIIVQYKLGMVTAQQVYAEYQRLYQEDKASFQKQNALKLALTDEFFNKSIKGNADYIKILGTYYTSDLSNFQELAKEKLNIDLKLQKSLGENWAQYYKTYAEAVKASTFNVMSEEEFIKRTGESSAEYKSYVANRERSGRRMMTDEQRAEYDRLMKMANLFDELANKAAGDIDIKIPDFSKSTSGSSKTTDKKEPSLDEIYKDLKDLQEETERQNDRLTDMTQDTTKEQISLWYNLRNAAVKKLNEITDHTSEAYRYVEDIVRSANNAINDLYNDQLDAMDDIIGLTEDMLKKQADDEVDALEDQVDKYKEIIELKKKLIEQSDDEEDYERRVAKIVKEIADLQESISQLDLEIKSNPEDSRKAQAEQQKLLKDLQSKQDELAELQRQHWKDAITDRLDDEADAFEKSKQEEIDKIKDTVDDDKKLHQKAIDYIDDNWGDLYDQLSKYAKEQGRDVEKELTKAWDIAKDAVDAYGGSIIAAMDNIEKMQSMIQSTTKEGNYNQVGELAGNPQLMAIVKAMKKNSTDYLQTSDTNVKQSIKANQADLVKQFESISGRDLVQGSDGTWYLDKDGGETLYSHFGVGDVVNPYKQNTSSGSSSTGTSNPYTKPSSKTILKNGSSGSNVGWVQTQLNKAATKDGNSSFKVSVDSKYGAKTTSAVRAFQRAKGLSVDGQVGPETLKYLERYHTGGIVGGGATLKDNEMLAVLENRETVLTNSMWKNLGNKLTEIQDFISSCLPQIQRFSPAGTPAYAGTGGMTVAPVVNVQFEHHGDFDEKAAEKFASKISDFTIKQIQKNQQTHRFRK